MKLNDRFVGSLSAIFLLTIFFAGSANAIEYSGSAPGDNLALLSPEVSVLSAPMTLAKSVASSAPCVKWLPNPRLNYAGKENVTVSGVEYTRYKLEVLNSDDYSASLFKPAPNLPPCGLNNNSSRTWVAIYNQNSTRMYGFCALNKPSDMKGLWFAVAKGNKTLTAVYITLEDRACNINCKSNIVQIK